MNIEYLKYFVVIAETLNLNKASEKLHITPQALSKAIKILEDYYNIKLLERSTSIKSLTNEGEYFLEKSIKLIEQYDTLDLEMKELKYNNPQGNLLIACDSMCQNYILPELINNLLIRYDKIIPKIYTMIPNDVEKNILSNNIHLGFITQNINNKDLCSMNYKLTESVIVGNKNIKSKWYDLNFIVPNLFNRKLTNSLDGWNDYKYPRKIILEVESLETAIRFCEKGIGVAFLPRIAIEEKLIDKSLFIITEPPEKYFENIYLVYKKNSIITSTIKAFLEII